MAAASSAASPPPNQNAVFPKSHVGFDSITSQIERKLLKRGFQFNVICVGTASMRIFNSLVDILLIHFSFHQQQVKPGWGSQP